MPYLLDKLLILIGGAFICLAIFKSFKLLPKLAKDPSRPSWLILICLMFFFILGYAYRFIVLDAERDDHLANVTAIIFAGGGIFVSIAINIAVKTIKSLIVLSNDLKKKVEIGSQELVEHRIKAITSSKLSALGEMAAGVAHEINNPLMIIYSRSAQLRKMCEREELDSKLILQHAAQIETTVERISKIIKGLRHFAQDSDKEPMDNISLTELVNSTCDLCNERFSKNQIEFSVSPIPEIILRCRSIQISQVLLNLLNNAFDAIIEQPIKKINLSFEVIADFVDINVTDNGPGIPADVKEKIMQPFFTTKPIGKGMGLGLSISKGIMEEHHGKLFLDLLSPETRFVMQLPILK